jgi:hypothetical protein
LTAVFDETALVLLHATGVITAAAFPPYIFARLPAEPVLTSFFLFFAASLLASEPGSK